MIAACDEQTQMAMKLERCLSTAAQMRIEAQLRGIGLDTGMYKMHGYTLPSLADARRDFLNGERGREWRMLLTTQLQLFFD